MIRASRSTYLAGGLLVVLAVGGWSYAAGASGQRSEVAANAASANATATPAAPAAPAGEAAPPAGAPAAGDPAAAAPAPAAPAAGAPVAAAPEGVIVTSLANKAVPRMGNVVQDNEGWTLYRFDKDKPNPPTSNCAGDCAKKWPPVLVGEQMPTLEGIDASLVGTVQRPDGGKQLTLGGWPLYRFAADGAPGKWKGQGVGNTWFVVAPDGKKNLSCLPTPGAGAGAGAGSGNEGGGATY